ncbi:MAG: hypothetical protein IMZ65_03780 [Planctomycetes bacterium]|nr:hypothetical protein [Planctomycetota bacterium]
MNCEWLPPTVVGFALGFLGSYGMFLIQRRCQKKDDVDYCMKVVRSLISEIEEGTKRAKSMAEWLDTGRVSLARVYTALWESTNQRLAATLQDTEVLRLLHRIYLRFDLINFNCEADRPGTGAAFAKQYLLEVEENLSELKGLIENA